MKIFSYSSGDQLPFLTMGFKIFTHRSRHCLPHLPLINFEHSVHLVGPWIETQSKRTLSSTEVQLPFFADLWEFLNFCIHCLADFVGSYWAINSHSSPHSQTKFIREEYSCGLHLFPSRFLRTFFRRRVFEPGED